MPSARAKRAAVTMRLRRIGIASGRPPRPSARLEAVTAVTAATFEPRSFSVSASQTRCELSFLQKPIRQCSPHAVAQTKPNAAKRKPWWRPALPSLDSRHTIIQMPYDKCASALPVIVTTPTHSIHPFSHRPGAAASCSNACAICLATHSLRTSHLSGSGSAPAASAE